VSAEALWYVGRGTGVVTLVLFSLVVALGIGTRSARPLFGLPRFAVTAVHRSTSLLAMVFLAVHVTTMLLDPQAPLRLVDAVVPFVGSYRSVWLGLGTVAAELLVALVVTSLLRHRIGLRGWRFVHWAAYLAWPVALAHGLGTGTDDERWWLWLVAGGCVALVLGCVGWRLSDSFAARPALGRSETARPPRLEGVR
jgi:methionine sulfoxide reductase heme-binding subunit